VLSIESQMLLLTVYGLHRKLQNFGEIFKRLVFVLQPSYFASACNRHL